MSSSVHLAIMDNNYHRLKLLIDAGMSVNVRLGLNYYLDFYIPMVGGGGDNLHFLDFGHTQPTVGAKHKINDFCFLDFFISMKNTPYQGQKTKFCRFELCGISLAML